MNSQLGELSLQTIVNKTQAEEYFEESDFSRR